VSLDMATSLLRGWSLYPPCGLAGCDRAGCRFRLAVGREQCFFRWGRAPHFVSANFHYMVHCQGRPLNLTIGKFSGPRIPRATSRCLECQHSSFICWVGDVNVIVPNAFFFPLMVIPSPPEGVPVRALFLQRDDPPPRSLSPLRGVWSVILLALQWGQPMLLFHRQVHAIMLSFFSSGPTDF